MNHKSLTEQMLKPVFYFDTLFKFNLFIVGVTQSEFLHLKNEPQRAQSSPQRAQSFKIIQVAAFAPAGLTNPAAVRICQSEPSRERLFFQ